MAKRLSDMTPREARLSLRNHIISWAFLAEQQAGNPYQCVDAYGKPWEYATSFLDYADGESIAGLGRFNGHSVIFLLMIAATLDYAPS